MMERDTKLMRRERPWVFTNMRTRQGVDVVERFILERGGLA